MCSVRESGVDWHFMRTLRTFSRLAVSCDIRCDDVVRCKHLRHAMSEASDSIRVANALRHDYRCSLVKRRPCAHYYLTGKGLLVDSAQPNTLQDGYVSFLRFDYAELGVPLALADVPVPEKMPPTIQEIMESKARRPKRPVQKAEKKSKPKKETVSLAILSVHSSKMFFCRHQRSLRRSQSHPSRPSSSRKVQHPQELKK